MTGRPPFDDPNVIRLVTQQMPPSPRVARPDVPAELANVVMRCLAKRPADRFESYEALRAALEPFSSSAPSPAHLGVRFAAGLVDNIALMLLTLPVMSIWFDSMNPTGSTEGLATGSVASWIVVILYFGLMEGAWGRSPGKEMFGLRVVDAANQRPGIPVGLLRATIWAVAEGAPMLAYSLPGREADWSSRSDHRLRRPFAPQGVDPPRAGRRARLAAGASPVDATDAFALGVGSTKGDGGVGRL